MVLEARYRGQTCVAVGNALVTLDFGPRVIAFQGSMGQNLMAWTPDARLKGPRGEFRFHGGHRLWVAPESPELNYLPDEIPCVAEETGTGVRVTAPDNGSGFERSLELFLDGSDMVVVNTLTRVADRPYNAACWAITQLPPGGVAIVPFAPNGPRTLWNASHSLVFWPYSRPTDPRFSLHDDHVRIAGTEETEPFKIGVRPGVNSLGYLQGTELFIKKTTIPEGHVPEMGAAAQVYSGAGFVELETLGALRTLKPGTSTTHTERWQTVTVDSIEEAVNEVEAAA